MGRRRRRGRWRRRGPDEHGHLHAVPAVAAAADEVEPARGVEAEDEVAAAAVAEDRAAAVARRVRRLVHLHHVVPALLVVELCMDVQPTGVLGIKRSEAVLGRDTTGIGSFVVCHGTRQMPKYPRQIFCCVLYMTKCTR